MADENYTDGKRYKLGKRYFIHAYPIKGAKEKDGETLRSKRHRRISKLSVLEYWQNSIYYWWFECLKRNNDYKRCCKVGGTAKLDRLYRDFGNIYEYDDFWKWWNEKVNSEESRGEYLFAEAQAERIEVLKDGKVKEEEDYLIVKVPLSVRNQHLVRSFRMLLNDYEQQVQKVRKKSRAKYKVASKIPSSTFYKTLQVYDYKQANKEATHVEIAEACNLFVNTEYDYAESRGGSTILIDLLKYEGKDEKLKQRFKRVYAQRCSKQVAQLLKQADDYIASSATEFFPMRSK